MAERSFTKEIELLKLKDGETFHGEGILAVTKALLQSGISYVGGYQGAPVSHLVDVLVDAEELLNELGVHLETCTNEASAAAMLGASINYPVRGAVTWKSIVGTNVAADGLSNLASPGVIGGALIIVGEDYGEGASVIQERTHAYALKSSMLLLDPRPAIDNIVRCVEKAFEMSEASNTPAIMDLRIRACHVTGEFTAKNNKQGLISKNRKTNKPANFLYDRLAHPPVTFRQEKLKFEQRLPAAQKFIVDENMNERMGKPGDYGIIIQGGITNAMLRALDHHGLELDMLVLNVVHPLVPSQITQFCAGKKAVLLVEEGSPDFLEQSICTILRKADIQTPLEGKSVMPMAGELTTEVMTRGLNAFIMKHAPHLKSNHVTQLLENLKDFRLQANMIMGELPPRPPTFCTGCPERPVFSAIKLAERDIGKLHIAADIGCHAFGTFPPFSMGNSILGYGMSLASAAAVTPLSEKRTLSIMGDGGFWHNGVITGVSSALFNKGDGVLLIMANGYTSATGIQWIPSSKEHRGGINDDNHADIETTLKALGVKYLKRVRTYDVGKVKKTLIEAVNSAQKGLKVIIAEGECMLAFQRRLRGENDVKMKTGKRFTRVKYGIDEATCTGDQACIRLSGCPSLSIKPNPDPLRKAPVSTVLNSCVGCGLCGEVASEAVLCPSFYHVETIENATGFDKFLFKMRQNFIGFMQKGLAS
jgi:indolepyruvate ferredoxin oxidoreductase, alpha subunit